MSNGAADLLRQWRESECYVEVFQMEASSNTGWKKTGKISALGLTTFEISWDEGGSQDFSYNEITTLDGKLLRLLYPSGITVVVHEVKS